MSWFGPGITRCTGGIPHEKSPPIVQAHRGGAVPACWGATGAGAFALGPGGSPLFHLLGVSLGLAPPPLVWILPVAVLLVPK